MATERCLFEREDESKEQNGKKDREIIISYDFLAGTNGRVCLSFLSIIFVRSAR